MAQAVKWHALDKHIEDCLVFRGFESLPPAMNKYLSRITTSERGEKFNFLIWPFLLATFAYGVGFVFVLPFTSWAGGSTLFTSMASLDPAFPIIWGIMALATIVGGLSFLLFHMPPFGKISGLMGASLWFFASACYLATGELQVLCAVAIPNMMFWVWQYFTLSKFRRQERRDEKTLESYEHGDYSPKTSGLHTADNRREINAG